MLSRELTQRKDEAHVAHLLERINSPHIPPEGSPEGKQFRQTVIQRLAEQNLKANASNISFSESESVSSNFASCSCCCHLPTLPHLCPCRRKGKGAEPEIVWRRVECKSLETFEAYATAAIESQINCIRCLRAIYHPLSFWDDPHQEWEGLSLIGCFMWILAFSVQHIVDEDTGLIDETALLGIEAIKQQFREIAQGGEVFLELAERLASHTHRLREDGIETVKKIVKKWRLEAQSPLLKRPEVPLHNPKDPKRRIKGIGAAGAELAGEVDLSGGETNFHLNWVPLVVLIRSRKEGLKGLGWKDYGALNLYEKLHWFKVFGEKVLGVLEVEADDLHTVSTMLSEIQVDFGSGTKVNHARELSGALLYFSKSYKPPKVGAVVITNSAGVPMTDERTRILKIITEYWYTVDLLHEESSKLLRIIRETRDIIRTCYVYTDTFYKWGLPSYDLFSSKNSKKYNNAHHSSDAIEGIRASWDLEGSNAKSHSHHRRLSDISEMLVMMDFSTSAYQKILQFRPVEAQQMELKLESQNLGESDQMLGFGLVSEKYQLAVKNK